MSHALDKFFSCTRKVRHPNFDAAQSKREELEAADEVPMFIYDCPYCGGYHLTKRDFMAPGHRNRSWK